MQPPRQPARGYQTPLTTGPSGSGHRSATFRILLLLCLVFEMVNPVIPFHRLVLGRRRMKDRDVVVVGQPIVVRDRPRPRLSASRIAAGFEDEHLSAPLRKARGDGASTRAGADDDIVKSAAVRHEMSPLLVPGGFGLPPDRAGEPARLAVRPRS